MEGKICLTIRRLQLPKLNRNKGRCGVSEVQTLRTGLDHVSECVAGVDGEAGLDHCSTLVEDAWVKGGPSWASHLEQQLLDQPSAEMSKFALLCLDKLLPDVLMECYTQCNTAMGYIDISFQQ